MFCAYSSMCLLFIVWNGKKKSMASVRSLWQESSSKSNKLLKSLRENFEQPKANSLLHIHVLQRAGKLDRRGNRWRDLLTRMQNHGASSIDILEHITYASIWHNVGEIFLYPTETGSQQRRLTWNWKLFSPLCRKRCKTSILKVLKSKWEHTKRVTNHFLSYNF